MVKEKTGRHRYILFHITKGQTSRRHLNERLKQSVQGPDPRLTIYDGIYGIIKCHHYQKDGLRTFLETLDWVDNQSNKIKIKPIATSGTIKSLKKYF